MPFLRAALVKKKTPEPEEEIFQPAAVPVPVIPDDIDELVEELENTNIDALQEAIDKHTEENQEAELESQTDETQEAQAEAENDDNENLLPEEVPEMPSASEFIPESETEAGEENSQSDSPAVAIEENIVETQSEPAADEDSPTHETDLNSDETEISEEQNLEENIENSESENAEISAEIEETIVETQPEPVADEDSPTHETDLNSDETEISEEQNLEENIENSESENAEIEETIVETQPESVADEQENETETEPQDSEILSEDLNLETETESKDAENFELQYDFTSGERYVDKVSTKTEFDKMLDELAAVSKDLLAWEVEKFAKKYTGKFQGDFDKSESDAKKYEAFLGGYITNAAMTLYDNGYIDAAIKQLDQAKNILVARKKLEVETEAIKERVVEEDAAVDLSDILGMFGDG